MIGKSETGLVFEQSILLSSADGKTFQARRIIVQLHHPTRNGANEIAIFTNLPVKDADALKVAALYRNRWGIETAFQRLEKHFNSEINTLGYPKAALLGFCLALVAFNLYAVVRAAVRATHPDPAIDDEISDYYIAEEIAATYTGMVIIVPDEEWDLFRTGSLQDVKNALMDLALRMDLRKFKKNKRGPKKPSNPKTKFKGQPHVSTARLLAGQD